jgi:hypothetical protein
MNGKRKKPEPEEPASPNEQTITLPNGQVIKVSGNGNGQFQMQQPAQGDRSNQLQQPGEGRQRRKEPVKSGAEPGK